MDNLNVRYSIARHSLNSPRDSTLLKRVKWLCCKTVVLHCIAILRVFRIRIHNPQILMMLTTASFGKTIVFIIGVGES